MPVLKRLFKTLTIEARDGGVLEYSALMEGVMGIQSVALPRNLAHILEPSTLQYAFDVMDDDGDGKVDLTEFVSGVFCLAYTELPLETTHTLQLLRRQGRAMRDLAAQGDSLQSSVRSIEARLRALRLRETRAASR